MKLLGSNSILALCDRCGNDYTPSPARFLPRCAFSSSIRVFTAVQICPKRIFHPFSPWRTVNYQPTNCHIWSQPTGRRGGTKFPQAIYVKQQTPSPKMQTRTPFHWCVRSFLSFRLVDCYTDTASNRRQHYRYFLITGDLRWARRVGSPPKHRLLRSY